MSLPKPWKEAKPTANRVRAHGETLPRMFPSWGRILIDVGIDDAGNIVAYWGADDRNVGSHPIQVTSNGDKPTLVETGGETVLSLSFKVRHEAGALSIITPGTDP